jgi:hypothetical protein
MLEPSPLHPVPDAVERSGALDAPGRALGRFVRRSLGSGVLKNAISGTWLGNSVHAPLTDAVIGPLVSASLLDLLERDNPRAAQRLVEAGLVTPVPTVLAGFNDWADAEPADAGRTARWRGQARAAGAPRSRRGFRGDPGAAAATRSRPRPRCSSKLLGPALRVPDAVDRHSPTCKCGVRPG